MWQHGLAGTPWCQRTAIDSTCFVGPLVPRCISPSRGEDGATHGQEQPEIAWPSPLFRQGRRNGHDRRRVLGVVLRTINRKKHSSIVCRL